MGESAILRTEQLTVGYEKRPVVSRVTLELKPGEMLSLIGPNGAGKTTVLRTILRQLPPLEGRILLKGIPLQDYRERDLARCCAAVMTVRADPELMRCEDVVAAGRYPYTGRLGILSERDRRIIESTVRTVGIEEIRYADFDSISDGQRQRVLLARALCQEPELLVLDEPTSFLDIRHKLEFMELLRQLLREKRIAVIMSLHELELARKYSDRILCIREGRADRQGTPDEIFTGTYIDSLFDMAPGSWRSVWHTQSLAGRCERKRCLHGNLE